MGCQVCLTIPIKIPKPSFDLAMTSAKPMSTKIAQELIVQTRSHSRNRDIYELYS
jgi:hypothetical protein